MVPIQDRVTQQLTMKEEGLRSPPPLAEELLVDNSFQKEKISFLRGVMPQWMVHTYEYASSTGGKHELGKLVVNRLQKSYTKMWEGPDKNTSWSR